jgi:hypothetical protein
MPRRPKGTHVYNSQTMQSATWKSSRDYWLALLVPAVRWMAATATLYSVPSLVLGWVADVERMASLLSRILLAKVP